MTSEDQAQPGTVLLRLYTGEAGELTALLGGFVPLLEAIDGVLPPHGFDLSEAARRLRDLVTAQLDENVKLSVDLLTAERYVAHDPRVEVGPDESVIGALLTAHDEQRSKIVDLKGEVYGLHVERKTLARQVDPSNPLSAGYWLRVRDQQIGELGEAIEAVLDEYEGISLPVAGLGERRRSALDRLRKLFDEHFDRGHELDGQRAEAVVDRARAISRTVCEGDYRGHDEQAEILDDAARRAAWETMDESNREHWRHVAAKMPAEAGE